MKLHPFMLILNLTHCECQGFSLATTDYRLGVDSDENLGSKILSTHKCLSSKQPITAVLRGGCLCGVS